MKYKRNIVFVLNDYDGLGGAQRVTATLAKKFKEDHHKVEILSINKQNNTTNYFPSDIPIKVLHEDGYRAPLPKSIVHNIKSLKFKLAYKEIKRRKMLAKKQREVINYFSKFGNEDVFVIVVQVWGMQWIEPLLYQSNIRIIGQSHESYIATKNSHRYKRILKYYRQVSKFLLLSERDAKRFEADGFNNTAYIFNPTPFRSDEKPSNLYNNKTIISTGRLVEEKGYDILIQAFARIVNDIPDWELHIYGEGPERENLENLIDVLGLKDKVKLMGTSSNIQNALENSSFFVLASKAEGLPMSLIEAQSCGLPCISTDCAPGIRDIIDEYKNGLIVPVDDEILLARQMRRLAKDQNLFNQFSQNAYSASLKFEINNIVNQWYDLFDELEEKEIESND
jgi:glycosyltransferase involved in cell wall biosynthesis